MVPTRIDSQVLSTHGHNFKKEKKYALVRNAFKIKQWKMRKGGKTRKGSLLAYLRIVSLVFECVDI